MNLNAGEREAKIVYKSGDFTVISPGTYVICAVTQQRIPVDDLRYWNFERQEAYVSCEVSYNRELECNPHLRTLLGTTITER